MQAHPHSPASSDLLRGQADPASVSSRMRFVSLPPGCGLLASMSQAASLRTAVMDYGSESEPGKLPSVFNTATNDDRGAIAKSHDPRYRLFKVEWGA